MNDLIQKAIDFGYAYGPSVIGAILTLVVGWFVVGLLTRGARSVLKRSSLDAALQGFVVSVLSGLLKALVIISAVGKLGVETTSLAAIIAAAGLAIGLSLQGTLGNLAAGVMIMLFRPFKLGDYVEAGGAAGSVEEIAVFATTFKTPDNKKIIVPNGAIIGGNIANYSAKETRRIDLIFGIGYEDDIKVAKAMIESVVSSHSKVLSEPAPTIAVSELAESSVNLVVRPWCKTADYWDVYFELTEQLKLAADEKGISIPFPQRDLHVIGAANHITAA
ncbi:MAG: mechanosensitive ion channel domain-containing protein [Myxococcota bacterium]